MAKFVFKNRLWLSYIICVNVFVFARLIFQIVINNIFIDLQPNMGWVSLANSIFYILLLLCGSLASYLIPQRTILHASFITVIAMMFNILLIIPGIRFIDGVQLLALLALSAVLGGVGGALGLFARRFFQSRQK